MTPADGDRAATLRRGVYVLLIALAVGDMTGRLLAVNSVSRVELEQYLVNQRLAKLTQEFKAAGDDQATIKQKLVEARPQIEQAERRQTPLVGGNDRSRWLTIRALVDEGTFAIDGVVDRRIWNTLDMVQHKDRQGELHLYSSKPPLLSVLLAGEYWLVEKATGWTLADDPYEVARLMLWTTNILPMILLIAIVARWAERWGTTDWGRVFVVAVAALATLLRPFAVVLNNHLIGAVAAAVAFDAALRIWVDGERRVRWFALAGLAAAFTAADELPALSLLAVIGVACCLRDRRATLLGFFPAAGVVVAAFFATNYIAHDSWRPPYAHRSETDPSDNWYAYKFTVEGQERASYWLDPKGIDRGEPSKATYAFHMLLGHHGVFSLTPVWLLSAWGLWLWGRGGDPRLRQIALGVTAISLACIVFYAALRPQQDRNYGGMTAGFRWLLWLAPLWLAAMLPAADRVAKSRAGQAVALLLLALSVLSASYPTWNPWTQPWIHHWMTWAGWSPLG